MKRESKLHTEFNLEEINPLLLQLEQEVKQLESKIPTLTLAVLYTIINSVTAIQSLIKRANDLLIEFNESSLTKKKIVLIEAIVKISYHLIPKQKILAEKMQEIEKTKLPDRISKILTPLLTIIKIEAAIKIEQISEFSNLYGDWLKEKHVTRLGLDFKERLLIAIRENSVSSNVSPGSEPFIPAPGHTLSPVLRSLYSPAPRYQAGDKWQGKKIDEKSPLIGKLKEDSDGRALDGRGIALAPRHQIEKMDPEHRTWMNFFHTYRVSAFQEWKQNEQKGVSNNFFQYVAENNLETKMKEEALCEHNGALNYLRGKIAYLTKEQANQFLVSTNQNGQLYYASNQQTLDTAEHKEQSTAAADYIYVMDLTGNLFVSKNGIYPEIKEGSIQHSSFTAGERILCGGTLQAHNGKITHINNESGHYLPGGTSLSRLVDELDKRGVLAESVKIRVRGDERFPHKEISLNEFRDVLRVWPSSPLAKLDLSEKPNPSVMQQSGICSIM